MAKVLRGGKWGTVSRGSSSHSQQPTVKPEEPTASTDDPLGDDSGTIVAFLEEKKHLGIACYDLASNEIHISKVSCEADYSNANRVVTQLDTNIVILPALCGGNDALLLSVRGPCIDEENIKPRTENTFGTNDKSAEDATNSEATERDGTPERMVSFLPNSEFGLAKSTELCGFVNVRGTPNHLTPEERFTYLSHLLGEETCILRAVGGLLSFILQNGVLGTLGENRESIEINSIRYCNYCEVMKITPTTLRALHVFSQDTHPVGRGSLIPKEGLSLYGILKSHVKTASARKLLRLWLLYPSTSLETITQRQFVVDALRRSSNSAILQTLKDALRGVKNAPGALWRLRKVCAGINDWKALYISVKSFVIVLDTLKIAMQQNEDLARCPLMKKTTMISENHLRECVSWIDAVVDFAESTASGKMVVVPGFSEEIDEMKRCHSGLDDFLTSVGVEEHTKFLEMEDSPGPTSLFFTYQPQIGYLVVLSESDVDRIGLENLEQHGMSFVFSSPDQGYHYKNDRCRQLDNDLGDIHGAIMDLEAKAFRYLESKVFSFSGAIFEMATLVRELDCLQALACAANEYSWAKPVFVQDEDGLVIEDGRHPLMELVVSSFVPNPTNLRRGDVHILTGPNYSGKSVYLTQVALIVILAQIGSFVPAKKASMVVIESIESRISSFESVSHGQSSFFMDACQVSRMLAPDSGRALHLLDEFGKGTLEANGMALLAATLRELLSRPVSSAPLCLCTTHFVDILKEPCLPLANPRLSTFSMEVMTTNANALGRGAMRPKGMTRRSIISVGSRVSRLLSKGPSEVEVSVAKEDLEPLSSVVRTYRLLAGSVCHESRALQCALEAGVPRFILQRAAHVRNAISGTGLIENAASTEENNRRIRNCANAVRALLSTDYSNDKSQ